MQEKSTATDLVKAEIDRLALEDKPAPEPDPQISNLDDVRHRLAIAGQNVRSLFYLQPGKHE